MRGFTCGPAAAFPFVMTGFLAFSGATFAATVVLRDGTVIHGEILLLQDDVYSVETDSLGTIRVRKQEVRSIDNGAEPTKGTSVESSTDASSPGSRELDATKSRIVQDPELLAAVLALQSDPDVLAVLADPEITKAIAAGDYAALLNNPKIVALMHNAKMREIIDGVH
jgi:hypothetical protein